jgi:hypothetical protein
MSVEECDHALHAQLIAGVPERMRWQFGAQVG